MPLQSNLKLQLNRMHECPLGYGSSRFGIWLQGCNLACPGCCSRDTWGIGPRHDVPWSFFAATLEFSLSAKPLNGITISGGEPFLQKAALTALVREIRAIQGRLGTDWDILLYTGYRFEEIAACTDILNEVDMLVAGPYDVALPKTDLRGSSNQTLHWLTDCGRSRYSEAWLTGSGQDNSLSLAIAGNDLVWAGLPHQEDLPRLEKMLQVRGFDLGDVSWRGHRG